MRTVVGVMGAGDEASPSDITLAERLGEAVAREGWVLLTGGRPAGVMAGAIRGANRVSGSLTVSILPSKGGPVAPGTDIAVFTGLGEARNVINVLSCHVVITCGAVSAGTTSEAAFALKFKKPLVLLAPQSEAVTFFKSLSSSVSVAATPEQAISAARHFLRSEESAP